MKNILIVDDDEVITELLRVNLESTGYSINKTLTNIIDLKKYLKNNTAPDVVILDLLMDSDFGADMLGEIYKVWNDTKVYVFTGYSEYEDLYPFINDIVEAVFIKPDIDPLIKAIEGI
ncbi:response regulator [Elusimicrobiota bacterium]